jgi:hypothetical protein
LPWRRSISTEGGPEKAAAFLKETGATHLTLYTDPSGKLFSTLKAVGMPTTLLIDRDGKEIARLVGPAGLGVAGGGRSDRGGDRGGRRQRLLRSRGLGPVAA